MKPAKPFKMFVPLRNAKQRDLREMIRFSKQLGDRRSEAYWRLRLKSLQVQSIAEHYGQWTGFTHDGINTMAKELAHELKCSEGHAYGLVRDLGAKRLLGKRKLKGVAFW